MNFSKDITPCDNILDKTNCLIYIKYIKKAMPCKREKEK